MSKDLDELTILNRDYVASVQNCDVKRFDEILAQEFYCTNPDKSLVDRAGFLKQTAVPVTIRNLIADDVNIRVLGDFAIIHGRTSYTTATARRPMAATPTAGRGKTDAGSRCRRMWRGEIVLTTSFRGASETSEPGIHNPCREYGFRACAKEGPE
jgi:hypothetical protein